MAGRGRAVRLPPEVNRILFVRNLPFKMTAEEMYDIFGRYGALRQVRVGSTPETRGTAFVVYEDIFDAKNAREHLSGFNVGGRYLVVLYYQPTRMTGKLNTQRMAAEVEALKAKVAAGEQGAGAAAGGAAAAGGEHQQQLGGGGDSEDLDDDKDKELMRKRRI